MITDKELGGVQLLADNGFRSAFIQDYKINAIPRFLIIDPEGNIVSADAPRPSNPKLVKLFKEPSMMKAFLLCVLFFFLLLFGWLFWLFKQIHISFTYVFNNMASD